MEKSIGTFCAEDESRSDGFPKVAVHLLLRVPVNQSQQWQSRRVAQTGKLFQCVLGFDRQAVQFPGHEVDHIISVTLGVNAIQVPGPSRMAMIEGE